MLKDRHVFGNDAGFAKRARVGRVTGLELKPIQPFKCDSMTQPLDVGECVRYIEDNIAGSFDDKEFTLCNIKQDPSFLSVQPGMATDRSSST